MIPILRGTAAAAFLVVNTLLWFVPIALVGAVRRVAPEPLRRACGGGLATALQGWVACAAAMARALGVVRLTVAGAHGALRPDAWYLIVCNHQSWADILALVFAFRRRTPPFKFFTKRELVWLPFIGIALWLLDFPFVRRYGRARVQADPSLREADQRAVRDACAAIRERPTSVLCFLEGTRFTPAKRAAQGSPHKMLLIPKIGGLHIVRDGLADRLSAVLDVTLHYPGRAPGFWRFLCGRSPAVTLHIRVLPPPEGDREALRRWANTLWAEKDARLRAGVAARAPTA